MVTAAIPLIGAKGRARDKRGFNVIETLNAPFGSALAAASFERLASTGANIVALVPFFWQADARSPAIVSGDAVPEDRLRAGIAQANSAGLEVLVKPHVWVPGSWAGAIRMTAPEDWDRWFDAYALALQPIAEIAQEEGASALSIGTELRNTTGQEQWRRIIAEVRARFGRTLTYVAHGADEASRIAFWPELDVIGVSLYPSLGPPRDRTGWQRSMTHELGSVRQIADDKTMPFWLAEIGLRSAAGATLRPWESAEEREAPPQFELQAEVIALWLEQAAGIGAEGVFIWRWFSDPHGGGAGDTDFTVQNKPAEELLRQRWLRS